MRKCFLASRAGKPSLTGGQKDREIDVKDGSEESPSPAQRGVETLTADLPSLVRAATRRPPPSLRKR
ncbi:hypothetical protein LSTR_LSTR016640 [Laodelphax striatellus]|uniref:Uncharacterized protein n=1 Tax=Laodelphax striatellus TaxID=195883 RepID=A0A482XKA5_LAOST|nr:hypothetical protein LSTR_LSTR016640 [Laodelphax striatellus]